MFCFSSFQEKQGQKWNSTSREPCSRTLRQGVCLSTKGHELWTACLLYNPAPTFPGLSLLSSALLPGNEVIDSISERAPTQRQLLCTCFLWRTYRGRTHTRASTYSPFFKKKNKKTSTHKRYTFTSLVFIAASLPNLHVAFHHASRNTEQCIEQCICVCVFAYGARTEAEGKQ